MDFSSGTKGAKLDAVQMNRLLSRVLSAFLGLHTALIADSFIPGELLVKRRSENTPSGLSPAAISVPTVDPIRRLTRSGWELHSVPDGMSVAEAVAWYRAQPWVSWAEPNHRIRLHRVPNDPLVINAYAFEQIGAAAAWEATTGSSNLVVAVLDTGIDLTHPDLASNLWRNPGEIAGNGLDDDGNGYADDVHGWDVVDGDGSPQDDSGHGTHVGGIIGARGDNGLGSAGVCWQVGLLPVRIFSGDGSGSAATAAQALDYVVALRERGAPIRVINCSWGGEYPSTALREAFEATEAAGILSVCSAGNEHQNNDDLPTYPAGYDSPAIVSVAATSNGGGLSSYSNYGRTTVHLAAPGSVILSCYRQGRYAELSGTSMAAPQVSGAAALLLARRPTLTMAEVRNLILGTVDALPPGSSEVITGGRLNLERAMQILVQNSVLPGDPVVPLPAASAISLASRRTNGQLGRSRSVRAVVSADGRYVAFLSHATNLVDGDVEGHLDVFLHDRTLGTTVRVSQNAAGIGANDDCETVVISADGSTVAFSSYASNLVAGDTRGYMDIFAYNVATKALEVVSVRLAGGWPGGHSYYPSISANGRYVAFTSLAGDIVSVDSNLAADVFVRDRVTRTTGLVSYNALRRAGNGWSEAPSISAGGEWVAYHSSATDLSGTDTGIAYDVYLHHRSSAVTERISVSSAGVAGNRDSSFPYVSDDGRFVFFSSESTNLDTPAGSGYVAVFLRDRQARTTRGLSHDFRDGETWAIGLSGDGRFACFNSHATWSPLNGFPGMARFYVWDRLADVLNPGPFNRFGRPGLDSSYATGQSADGRFIAFASDAFSLVPRDGNAVMDVFVLDRQAARPDLGIRSVGGTDFVGSGRMGGADISCRAAQVLDAGGSALYEAQLLNAGSTAQSFRLKLGAVADGWNVEVTQEESGTSVTAALSAEGWITPSLAPGAELRLRIQASLGTAAVPEAWCEARLTSAAVDAPTVLDAVSAVTSDPEASPGLNQAWPASMKSLPDREANSAALSGDGQIVVFASAADQLVAGDRNAADDIFAIDRRTGELTMVSRAVDGTLGNQRSHGPSVSQDGRWVAFTSSASNLVTGDSNEVEDAFLKDRLTGNISRLSVSSGGQQADRGTDRVHLSGNGRFVALATRATNLAAGDDNEAADIFVRDLQTGALEWITGNTSGGAAANGDSDSPHLTPDGRFVLFRSLADNFGPGDENSLHDVYLFDRTTRVMELVSINTNQVAAAGSSSPISISADGRHVTFVSAAADLSGAAGGRRGVYVLDRVEHRVSELTALTGPLPDGLAPWVASVAPDGASLVVGAVPTEEDDVSGLAPSQVLFYHRATATWWPVSADRAGAWGADDTYASGLSDDGRWLLLETYATDLVAAAAAPTSHLLLFDARRYQPDTIGRRTPASLWHGEGQWPPEVQRVQTMLGPQQTHDFQLRMVNAGAEPDQLRLSADSVPGLSITVLTDPMGADLTGSVFGGGWVSPELAGQASIELLVRVQAQQFSGDSVDIAFDATSATDPRRVDRCIFVILADTDADAIADAWEREHFGNLSGAGAGTDHDTDGASDAAEYLAGSDPSDPVSRLRLEWSQANPGAPLEVHWQGFADRVFWLEGAVAPDAQFEAVTELIPGELTTAGQVIEIDPVEPHAVYRVGADLP